MRNLAQFIGVRTRFCGRFSRYGIRPIQLPPVRTFCLADIRDVDSIIAADHCWFTLRQRFAAIGELQEGQLIEFDATVTEYEKRFYRGRPERQTPTSGSGGMDYRLSYPANIVLR